MYIVTKTLLDPMDYFSVTAKKSTSCFFPSEDLNQTIALETSTFDEPLSDSSRSDLEVTQSEKSVGEELTRIGNTLVSPCYDKFCLQLM